MKAWSHFCTIAYHKKLVMQGCFRVGLYKQGILHDMSKYSPSEFFVGCKYYQGHRSPNNAEREAKGMSTAWLHHKGRNKHHYEYWIDYAVGTDDMVGMLMPKRYVVEMFMDRIAASKTYLKDKYTDSSALQYYQSGVANYVIHEKPKKLLEELLVMLSEHGEECTFRYIREHVLSSEEYED